MNSDFCVAVHAVVYLNHKKEICSSEQLSENICTHPARIRRVLSKLRKNGLLAVVGSGPGGGYHFTGDPEHITLADIAAALQITFVDPGWRSGSKDMECLIASGMGPQMDGIFDDLNTRCHSRLKEITISDLDHELFGMKSAKNKEGASLSKQ